MAGKMTKRAYLILNEDLKLNELVEKMDKFLSFDKNENIYRKISRAKKQNEEIVYQIVPMVCEKCGIKDDTVVYHHIYGRRYKNLQHDIDNRVPLCFKHHLDSSEFSAHKTPTKFKEWLIENRGDEWNEILTKKARKIK